MTKADEEQSMFDHAESLATGVIGLALLTTLVLPGRQTAKILQAHSSALSGMVRAATGGAVAESFTTPAERFNMEAMEALGRFWSGFGE